MKVEVRNGKAYISGYVNAVGRDSDPIQTPTGGQFVEMIEPGTFREALTRAKNVDMLLDHNEGHKLASTAGGTLKLKEDNIGLYAESEVSDAAAVEAARRGDLRGWSFGMLVNKDEMEQRGDKIPRRHVQNIDIIEVSLIDTRMKPCYAGTSVECRADRQMLVETRSADDSAEVTVTDTGTDQRDEWQKKVNELNIKTAQDRVDALKNKAI
jgi:hypothetical protein